MSDKACIWGGCNGSLVANRCDRCGTVPPAPLPPPQPVQEFLETLLSCCHCGRVIDDDTGMEVTLSGGVALACFSCATGLPLEKFQELKRGGHPIPLLNNRDA